MLISFSLESQRKCLTSGIIKTERKQLKNTL